MSKEKEVLVERVREFERRTGSDVDSWPDDANNTASVLSEKRRLTEPVSDDDARRAMRTRSRRGFIVGGSAALLGVFGWRWMGDETKGRLLRRTFEFNEKVARLLYSGDRLAPEFSASQISPPRVNGIEGLEGEVDAASWRLELSGLPSGTNAMLLSLDDIRRLPRTEMITELKCIEGWSVVVQWAGVRFSDFAAAFSGVDPASLPAYVSLSTPDEKYFVGWDLPSILHPQTLLAYEMNGEPLRPEHGAPLRLASPTKYGIKQIKRIGRIMFTNERPKDFWAEEGYDWYSGH